MDSHNQHRQDRETQLTSEQFAEALKGLFAPGRPVPGEVDLKILDRARRQFGRSPKPMVRRWAAVAAAAAAMAAKHDVYYLFLGEGVVVDADVVDFASKFTTTFGGAIRIFTNILVIRTFINNSTFSSVLNRICMTNAIYK